MEKPFQNHGRTGECVALAMLNLLLNIVTLSLWRFWGKTRVRRFLWSQTTLWGDPLEYTGRGGELFKGFLLVLFLIFLPLSMAIAALQALVQAGHPMAALGVFVLQLGFAVLAGAGFYRAYRYQLTRTVWRGIRASLDGSAWNYGLTTLAVILVVPLSLGWALPWAQMKLARYRLDNTKFGDLRFECTARAKGLYGRFAVVWLLTTIGSVLALWLGVIAVRVGSMTGPLTAGIGYSILAGGCLLFLVVVSYAWYKTAFYHQLAAATRFNGHSFTLGITAWPLIRLAAGNMLISLLSLGVLQPWAALRAFRFTCAHLEISGQPDFERIHQSAADRSRMGEGLSAVFDGAGAF